MEWGYFSNPNECVTNQTVISNTMTMLVSSPSGVWGTAPAEIEFGAFQPSNMTSGGKNFNYFFKSTDQVTSMQFKL